MDEFIEVTRKNGHKSLLNIQHIGDVSAMDDHVEITMTYAGDGALMCFQVIDGYDDIRKSILNQHNS